MNNLLKTLNKLNLSFAELLLIRLITLFTYFCKKIRYSVSVKDYNLNIIPLFYSIRLLCFLESARLGIELELCVFFVFYINGMSPVAYIYLYIHDSTSVHFVVLEGQSK